MSGQEDLEPLASTIDDVFTRLGLPDPRLMSEITREWDELAGTPWAGRSRPVMIENKTLVVEASAPSMVAFLKYGEAGLLQTLRERLGAGLIESVEVRPPGRR